MTERRAFLVTGTSHVDASNADRLYARVDHVLKQMARPGDVVVTGQATGVDEYADLLAGDRGIYRVRVPYHGAGGRAGGPMRNKLMVEIVKGLQSQGFETVCLGFKVKGQESPGTDNCMSIATKMGLMVHEFVVLPEGMK